MAVKSPPFIRLYKKIEKDENDCWNWLGNKCRNGYGQIKAFGKEVLTHRLSYELYNGKIPDGLEVCHKCDNRACINPDHLFVATHQENMRDMIQKGRKKTTPKGTPSKTRGIKSKQSIQVRVMGKVYGSINDAERALNIGSGSVSYWIKTNNPKAKIISREEYRRIHGN